MEESERKRKADAAKATPPGEAPTATPEQKEEIK